MKILLFLLPIIFLAGCNECKPTEVIKEVEKVVYQYTWINAEYKIWQKWYWYDTEINWYREVTIDWLRLYCIEMRWNDYNYSCYDYIVRWWQYQREQRTISADSFVTTLSK